MKWLKTVILFLTAFGSFMAAGAQGDLIIRGRIIDKTDQMAVIGANVVEYDNENRIINGTITNVNGDFVLKLTNPANTVRVSIIGYETTELEIDFTRTILLELESTNLEIDEVTITAETKSYHSLTNLDDRDKATSSVKLDLVDSQDAGVVSAADALQGKVSGLDIISASGDPGSGSQMVIRGLSSIGNNRPLIVIDGIPSFRVGENFDLSSADTEDISNLINIAVQDIKSIEVLKDAASSAIYGSRGADGVLLIETRKGRMGKVQFDYQFKNSLNIQPPAIPMLNGDEYIMLQLEEWHNNSAVYQIPTEIAYDRTDPDFYNYSANTDWLADRSGFLQLLGEHGLACRDYANRENQGSLLQYFRRR
jgi:TonB-dependent SusC/RagA subfamily outer membrane receptor